MDSVQTALDIAGDKAGGSQRGLFKAGSNVSVESQSLSGITVTGRPVMAAQLAKFQNFDFEKLGIGGLDSQFRDIFRRAFASRVFPPDVIKKMGMQHVKGMLLYGPPGTGKTLVRDKDDMRGRTPACGVTWSHGPAPAVRRSGLQ